MRRALFGIAFLVATVGAAALPFGGVRADEEAAPNPPDDVAEILVLGPEGHAIEGARVELLAEPAEASDNESAPVAATGTTGKDGRLRVPVTPFARYLLRVSKAPFATAGDTPCFGGNVTTFRLSMPGRVHGVVRARETGRPLAGATVRAVDHSLYGLVRSWEVVADEAGHYVIDDAAPGSLNLEAWAPGFTSAYGTPTPMIKSGSAIRCDIELPPSKTLVLTVLDDRSGEPVPEVTLTVGARTVTGSGAKIDSPPIGVPEASPTEPWRLEVKAPGFLPQWVPHVFPDGFASPPDALTLRLRRPIPVEGRIVDKDGEPVSGMEINVLFMDARSVGAGQWPTMTHDLLTTDPDGAFHTPVGIPGADLFWQIHVGGAWCRGLHVRIPPDVDTFQLETISLSDGVRVSGRVRTADGTHPTSSIVRADRFGVRSPFALVACVSDPRGRFLLPWVLKGKTEISAESKDLSCIRVLELDGDAAVALELGAKEE